MHESDDNHDDDDYNHTTGNDGWLFFCKLQKVVEPHLYPTHTSSYSIVCANQTEPNAKYGRSADSRKNRQI